MAFFFYLTLIFHGYLKWKLTCLNKKKEGEKKKYEEQKTRRCDVASVADLIPYVGSSSCQAGLLLGLSSMLLRRKKKKKETHSKSSLLSYTDVNHH